MVNIHDANTTAQAIPLASTEQMPDSPQSPLAHSVKIVRISRKRPVGFYIRISKELLITHDEVVLSGLGLAMSTAIFVADILEKSGQIVVLRTFASTHTHTPRANLFTNPLSRCGNLHDYEIQRG